MSMIDSEKLIQDVEYLISHTPEDSKEHYAYKICKELINSQPAADQWIPVVERLPERNDFYDVTFELDCGVRLCQREYFDIEDNRWLTPYNVVAWKERPEPYKGVE